MMKRKLSMLLCAVMVLGTLVGCGGEKTEENKITETTQQIVENSTVKMEDIIGENGEIKDRAAYSKLEVSNPVLKSFTGRTMENVSYVMIYNPFIFDEGDGTASPVSEGRSTGNMSSQIVVGMNKAGGLAPDIEIPTVRSQAENDANVDTSGVNRDGIKSGAMDPVYKVNDRQAFYHYDETATNRMLSTFDCVYSGTYCYIWSLNGSISSAEAQIMANEFDNNIYQKLVTNFGKARFTDGGGKINLLFYPMMDGLGGFFTSADIFSSAEVPEEYRKTYGFNVDHAIINLNTLYLTSNPEFAVSTMAHELQHLICASDCFNYAETPWMATWLNESMSAYAEEMVYPGIKEAGYYNQFMYLSNNYRTGQSLYNFDTSNDENIGAYGAVYLFAKYLEQLDGPEVFNRVHEYWRASFSSTVDEAWALMLAISDDAFKEINEKYVYSPRIYSELMGTDLNLDISLSKLTLDFYIETLKPDLANLNGYEDAMHSVMLYTEILPVEIEGGGRILVATQNGSYEIPTDADWGLVYIGLDENFNVVSMYGVE